jgi:hypothetical protein
MKALRISDATGTRRLVPALAAATALFVLQGPSWMAAGGAIAVLAVLLGPADPSRAAAAIALALSAAGRDAPAQALLMISGALICLSGRTLAARTAGLASVLIAGQAPHLSNAWVPGAVLLTSVLPAAERTRLALAGITAAAAFAFFGPPAASLPGERVMQELFAGGRTTWPDMASIDLGHPVMLLRVTPDDGGTVTIRTAGGGIRTAEPLGMIISDEQAVAIIPGLDTLSLYCPQGTASILLTRSWRPFEHPVIHAGPGSLDEAR